jgi:hypothetical protein
VRPINVGGPFAEITATRECRTAVETAIRARCVVRVSSDPGRGKTFSLWRLVQEYGGGYCQVVSEQKSGRGFWEMLLAARGIQHDYTHAGDLADLAYRSFDCRPRDDDEIFGPREPFLLVVDEYQNIEPAYQRELLSLQEAGAFALVLAGNSVGLRQRKTDRAAIEQIDDRIWHNVAVSPLSQEDCRSLGVEFNVEGRDAYDAVTSFGQAKNAWQLVRLLTNAKALTQGVGSIQLRHLEQALIARNGDGKDLRLLEGAT